MIACFRVAGFGLALFPQLVRSQESLSLLCTKTVRGARQHAYLGIRILKFFRHIGINLCFEVRPLA
jgi:hypothetical protein